MKFAAARPYSNPEAAARKLIEIANSVEAVQDGRIHIDNESRGAIILISLQAPKPYYEFL
jgi:hypothetical protein